VLFFDIRMPGMSGLDAAVALADAWDTAGPDARPFPALVFVTAYEQYAVQAFEAQAIDYVLKPVQAARLQKTVSKVQLALASHAQAATNFEATLAQLRALTLALPVAGQAPGNAAAQPPGAPPALLTVIQASVGNHIHMVPIGEVLLLDAADKYVQVFTAQHEYLIRTPLKDLLPQLDAAVFWQIHRGTVVRASQIEVVTRDEAGKLWLQLRGQTQKHPVSRLYAHLFKAM
jgi:DNA-binding LytR/AlgR family response regulator